MTRPTPSPTPEPATVKPQQGVQSVEIGADLLRLLARTGRAMPLHQLAAAAAMPAAKVHRYLVSLIRGDLVEQEAASGHYRLGRAAVEIGLAALGEMDAVRLGGEILPTLRDRLAETVLLAVWGNKGPVVVRWEEAPRPVTTNVRAGSVMPLKTSATGRAFAAFLPENMTRPFIAAEQQGPTPDRFANIMARARQRRMTRVRGDLLPGIHSLAAPVFGHDGQLACVLATLGAAEHFDSRWGGDIAGILREAAARLSARLGYRDGSTPD